MSDLERTVAEVRAALAKATRGRGKSGRSISRRIVVQVAPQGLDGHQAEYDLSRSDERHRWTRRSDAVAAADRIANRPARWLSALCDGVEAMQRERDALQNDLMTCVAPAEVGGGIVNWTIDQLRERVSTLEAEPIETPPTPEGKPTGARALTPTNRCPSRGRHGLAECGYVRRGAS